MAGSFGTLGRDDATRLYAQPRELQRRDQRVFHAGWAAQRDGRNGKSMDRNGGYMEDIWLILMDINGTWMVDFMDMVDIC